MNLWRRFVAAVVAPFAAARFAFSGSSPRPIDQVFLDLSGVSTRRVSREVALSVPAVQRGRNLICSISTLPLVQRGPDQSVRRNPLLEQIDPDVANVVTLAQTLEDLLFESIAWWEITAQDREGYPTACRRRDPSSVSLEPPASTRQLAPLPSGFDPRGATVWVDGRPVPASRIIRFDSPNPAVLTVGARAIRRAILLDAAASMYADDPRPLDYFQPAEDAEDIADEDVAAILAGWKAARKKRSTAWVPRSMTYHSVDTPSPQQLQLVELQKQVAIELSNSLGVDPEELGISTTSRTYANAIDRRRDRVNDVLSPFMQAIAQRLSMGDVTRRGQRIDFDLDDYMRSNPTERVAFHKSMHEMGAITVEEIRGREKLGPLPATAVPAPRPPVEPAKVDEATVDASRDAMFAELRGVGLQLSAGDGDGQGPAMTFAGGDFAGGTDPASVDVETRTITGLAVPYNKIARKYGLAFRFRPGSLEYDDVSRIKALMDHRTPVGVHTSVKETARGPVVKLKVLSGPEGSPTRLERDQLLYDAQHGLYDGLSIGVDFSLDPKVGDVEWNEKDQVYDVLRASWRETSSTPMPAFDDARVTKVAASRTEGNPTMPCQTCGQVHAEGVACPSTQQTAAPAAAPPAGLNLSQDQLTALLTQPGAIQALVQAQQQPAQPATPAGGLTLSADQVQGLIKSGGLGVLLGVPQLTPAQPEPEPARQVVDPTHNRQTVTASVTEPLPYRFDSQGNLMRGVTYDFSTDLVAGSKGDGEAMARATAFLQAQAQAFTRAQTSSAAFDVDTTDAAALNPNRNRPDLYVDQKDFSYPVWDAISKGTLADMTPFVLPKFNTSSGLVAAHVEGTGPTPGAVTATSQTITPSAVSGKVEITREAWDQGGNPQLSGIIWRQMTRAWFEALEASAVALLDGLTPTAIALTTAAQDDALVGELESALAALQYVRGGLRMRDLFLQTDLYSKLVGAVDADGRRLLPLLGPVNASGTTSELYADVNVGGLRGRPAWALAATTAASAKSHLFDRADVHGWASAPQRLQFEYRVEYVDVAIWGYKALANTDLGGVRVITYARGS